MNSKVLGVLTSGTGLIGDALGDAYEKAKDLSVPHQNEQKTLAAAVAKPAHLAGA